MSVEGLTPELVIALERAALRILGGYGVAVFGLLALLILAKGKAFEGEGKYRLFVGLVVGLVLGACGMWLWRYGAA